MGSNTRILLSQLGMICIGVADHTRCLKSSEGFNVYKLKEHVKKNKSLQDYDTGEEIDKKTFFSTECDIVIPAAKELEICGDDAKDLKCRVIVEAANGPLDLEAEKICYNKNIDIIPDILANSGGVIVSYYEWLQNKRCEYWDEEEVILKLKKKMMDTFNKIYIESVTKNISMREACYIYAYKKIESVVKRKKVF